MGVSNSLSIFLGANLLVIKLIRFWGEPEGGLAWPNQPLPFALIEVGVSDSGKKTRGRIVHWLTKGEGKVCSAVCELLIFRYALELV